MQAEFEEMEQKVREVEAEIAEESNLSRSRKRTREVYEQGLKHYTIMFSC